MACKHPFPAFSSLYILHYLDAVCPSENLDLLLFSNWVSFSTVKSLVFCKAKLGSNPCLPNCQISQQVYLYHYKHGTCCCWVSQSYHDRKKRTTSTSIIALHWICSSLWKRIIQCDLERNIWRGRRHTNLSTRSIRCCIFLRRIICFCKTC